MTTELLTRPRCPHCGSAHTLYHDADGLGCLCGWHVWDGRPRDLARMERSNGVTPGVQRHTDATWATVER